MIQDTKTTTNSISQFAETFCFSQAAILCFHLYQFNFKKGLTNYIEIFMMFIYDANWNFQWKYQIFLGFPFKMTVIKLN